MKIIISAARRRQLAVLAEPLTLAESAALTIPTVIGSCDAAERQAVDYETDIGHFNLRGDGWSPGVVTSESVQGNFLQLAHDLTRPTPLRNGRDLTAPQLAKAAAQIPLVAALLRADRELFGSRAFRAEFTVAQDHCGPVFGRTAYWHQDTTREPVRDAEGRRMVDRVYIVRTAAPTEMIRGRQAAARPDLVTGMYDKRRLPKPDYAVWEQEIRKAGLFFQPRPYDVTLLAGDQSWHCTHHPAQPVPSSFLRLHIYPAMS